MRHVCGPSMLTQQCSPVLRTDVAILPSELRDVIHCKVSWARVLRVGSMCSWDRSRAK